MNAYRGLSTDKRGPIWPQTRGQSGAGTVRKGRSQVSRRSIAFERLEERRLLACDLPGFAGSLRQNLGLLQVPLDGMVASAPTIPLVDSHLASLPQLDTFTQASLQAVTSSLEGINPVDANAVRTALYGALGPGGLGLFNAQGQLLVTADAVACSVHVDMSFHQSIANVALPLNAKFGVGLDALPIEIATSGGLNIGLTFQEHVAFTFSTAGPQFSADAMSLSVTAALTSGSSFEAIVGFLPVTITDNGTASRPTRLQGNFTANNVLAANRTYSFNGTADLYLDAAARLVGTGDEQFPGVGAELEIHWNLNSNNPTANPPTVKFTNVTVDTGTAIGSVFGPVVEFLAATTLPLSPLIDIVKYPIPVLTDLSNAIGQGDVTLQGIIDAANAGGAFGGYGALVTLISTMVDITDAIQGIDGADNLKLNLGSFDLANNADLRTLPGARSTSQNPLAIGNLSQLVARGIDGNYDVAAVVQSLTAQLDSIINDVNSSAGLRISAEKARQFLARWGNGAELKFPILDNPLGVIFPMLLGQDANLVEFSAQYVADAAMDQDFGLGPAGVNFSGAIHIDGLFKVGYDTYGLRKLLFEPSHSPAFLQDGLHFDNRSHLVLGGRYDATVYVPVPLPFVEIGGSGGLTANAEFHLNDPSAADGKLRFSEINPACLFAVSGSMDAGIGAFIKVGVDLPLVGFVGFEKEFDIASINILDLNVGCIGINPEPPPRAVAGNPATGVGEVAADGTLTLFMGPFANLRTGASSDDTIHENFVISHVSGSPGGIAGETITIHAFGIDQIVPGVKRIVAFGGDGEDVITINPLVASSVDLHGGDGHDRLTYGGEGIAMLYGDAGQDSLTGGPNADFLDGGLDNDFLVGLEGHDNILGGAGDDQIYGGIGNDNLSGADGNDEIAGGEGDDTLTGGIGNDRLYAEQGTNQFLYGNDGNDSLWSLDGRDTLYGGSGDDMLVAGLGNDDLFGEGGIDGLFGDGGDDLLDGGSEVDRIEGGTGVDTIRGGSGSDFLYGNEDRDVIDGQEGDDTIDAGSGNNEVVGGLGNDIITTFEGNDTIFGNSGADSIYAGAGADLIDGGPDADLIYAEAGNDIVVGGDGDDTIEGGLGDDTLLGDVGQVTSVVQLLSGDGRDTIRGQEGDDLIYGQGGDDILEGQSGKDTIFGHDGIDTIRGGTDRDYIVAGNGDDSLEGNDGDDLIEGGTGTDIIAGGSGLDRIYGGDGNDHILGFGVGDGDDGTADTLYGESGNDFVDGQGGDDYLDGGPGVDTLHGSGGDDVIVASDGIGDFLYGDDGDDQLIGSDEGSDFDPNFFDTIYFGDVIDGGLGNDTINGLGGADYIMSASGDDWVDAGRGSDRIRGGLGNDYLYAGRGFGDIIEGEDGNDVIYGSPEGHDNLSGGAGQDRIYGQGGNDQITGDADDDHLDGGSGTDGMIGGTGNDTLLGGGGVGDSLDGGEGSDILHGSDDGADSLIGGEGRDSLFGHGGNDSLAGGLDDDLLDGGAGDDTLSGDAGSDLLQGSADHDVLYGQNATSAGDENAVDYLYGDFGTNRNEVGSGRDRLFGQGGNDRIWGEGNDDFIDVGAGTSNLADYGSGESAIPSDFVTPTPTPNPTVQPGTSISHAAVNLPNGVDTLGRWSELAGSGSGDGVSQSSSAGIEPTVVVDEAGVQYVAWADSRNGNFEIYVARHLPGLGWREISASGQSASEGGVSNTASSSRRPSLAIDTDGNPIVAWTEYTGNARDVRVAKFDPLAAGGVGAWITLGNSLSANGISGTGQADAATVLITGGGPTVAWLDTSTGVTNIFAKRFAGGNWLGLGGAIFSSGIGISQSSTSLSQFAAATDGTKVTVAWTQPTSRGSEIYLREFGGTIWNEVADSASDGGLSSLGGVNQMPTVAYHAGAIYVAWQGDDQARPEIFARKYTGATWQNIGGGSGDAVSPPRGIASQPQLASRGGKLHLVWIDDTLGSSTSAHTSLFSTRWNGTVFAPELASDIRTSVVELTEGFATPRLAVDASGRPLLVWSTPGQQGPQVFLRTNLHSATGIVRSTLPTLSVQEILDTFDLGPGDVIHVSATSPGFTLSPNDSGVMIVGAPGASITSPIEIAGATDVVLQGITAIELVTIRGGSRNAVVTSQLLGGINLINSTNAYVIGNDIEIDGIRLSGAVESVVMDNSISLSPIAIEFHTAPSTNVIVRGNRIAATAIGISIAIAGGGVISDNTVSSNSVGLDLRASFAGSIARNNIHGASIGLQYGADAALDGNRIYGNITGVVATVNNTAAGFGYVLLPGNIAARANEIFANDVGVQLNGMMQAQHVHDNQIGVSGSGSLAVSDFGHANRIESNGVGIDVGGSVQFNFVGGNETGIVGHDRQLIAHNQIYRNTLVGIDISGKTTTRVVSNTLYGDLGDLVRIEGGSREIELTNNQFWTESGTDITMADDSQAGFWSDYNLLHAGAAGKLVHWSSRDFYDILDWQADVSTFDLHSRGKTVVNPGWSEPRFVDAAADDFRTLELTGLQRFSNPSIDAGDPRIDLGNTVATPTNLLTNSIFSAGLSGWTTNAGAHTSSTNPNSFDDNPSFRSGTVAVGFIEQTIDLLAKGFSITQLDSSDLVAVFGGRIRTAAEPLRDTGRITLRFLSGAGGLLSERTAEATGDIDRWELVGERLSIPVGTRRLIYRFESIRATDAGTSDAVLNAPFLRLHDDQFATDIGAWGNTPLDAPAGSSATLPRIALRAPDLYADWERDRPHTIRWESYGNTNEQSVRIDLFQDGPHGAALLSTLVAATSDDGEFSWIPSNSAVNYGTHGLRIQIQLVGDSIVLDRGTEPFSVPENTTTFFVNDRVTTDDEYTTAAGSNRATGKLASGPKPYPNNVVQTYSLGPTHTLSIDTGDYPIFHSLVIANKPGIGDDEGFMITGPTNLARTAALRHAIPGYARGPVVELDDADSMTLSHLTTEGGTNGLWIHNASETFFGHHISVTRAAQDGIRFESTASGSTLDHVSATANGGHGIHITGSIDHIFDSDVGFNIGTGIYLSSSGLVQLEGNELHDNRGMGLFLNHMAATQATIGNPLLTVGRGNIIRENAGTGIDARGNVLVVGNTVSGQRSANTNGIVLAGGTVQHNVVWDNYNGIVGGTLAVGNRVYQNAATGIVVAAGGTARDNVVYSNLVGLDAQGGNILRNNLVYANSQTGIRVRSATVIINNTVYQTIGNAVQIAEQSADVQMRNNIVWSLDGYNIAVPASSQSGFQSDYNLLYATGSGTVGQWQGLDRTTLADWQTATFLDQNSLGQDPLFVDLNGADNLLGFSNQASDGRDDDFHEQSSLGSFHGGSLAPVIGGAGVVIGLPVFLAVTLVSDLGMAPGIDRGSMGDSFVGEGTPNGGFINLGAYGNTGQASISPAQYVLVTRPDGGERWPAGQSFAIRWRSHNQVGNAKLEVVDGNSVVVTTIAASTPNDGEFIWAIPGGITAGGYRIRITRLDAGLVNDDSNAPFTIPAPVNIFYVNDGSVNATGDLTTAPGNDANDGLSAATPKASLRALLDAYDFGPSDTIRVDTGVYLAATDILLSQDDSGVRIEGYHDPAFPSRQSVLNRGSTISGNYVLRLTGADDVTLDHLVFTGGEYGLVAANGADSDRLTVTSSEFFGNLTGGIFLDATNDRPQLIGNDIHDQGQHGIQLFSVSGAIVRDNLVHDMTFGTGIEVRGAFGSTEVNLVTGNDVYNNTYGIIAFSNNGTNAPVTVDDNEVHHSRLSGIQASGLNVLVANNRVYANSSAGQSTIGILAGSAMVRDNLVFDNVIGISANAATIQTNRVYHNQQMGITENTSTIERNVVYSNPIGIQTTSGLITNNLIYASDIDAIRVNSHASNSRIVGNTVYQPGSGNAIRIGGFGFITTNTTVRNNILSVAAGYAIFMDPANELGFASDYNDIHTTGAGKIGRWANRDFANLADWYYELGLDQHSQSTDPLFVDLDGADNQLGYIGATDFGLDDNFGVAIGSPTLDAGDPAMSFANEPAPAGGRINLGHTGNTNTAITSLAQFVQVLAPNGLEKWEKSHTTSIAWRTSGILDPDRTVDIAIVRDDALLSVIAIAQDTPDDGAFAWMIPETLAEGSYRIQIMSNQGVQPTDLSDRPFLIVNSGQHFYVNDSSLAGDAFSTVAGNNANSGKSPNSPLASLSGLISAYDFDPGDTIHLDTGNYTTATNVVLGVQESGIRIEGPGAIGAPGIAAINRGNTSADSYVVQLAGADDVTLDHITFTGGAYGIIAHSGADSDGLRITNSTIRDNARFGISLSQTNDNVLIAENVIQNNLQGGIDLLFVAHASVRDNEVYGNHILGFGGTGINFTSAFVAGSVNSIHGNDVYDNDLGISTFGNLHIDVTDNRVHHNVYGVLARNDIRVLHNEVYSNHILSFISGYGITASGSVVDENVVYDNIRGIDAATSIVRDNRVYFNRDEGIRSSGLNTIQRNSIYNNQVGIHTSGTNDVIHNNLIYANAGGGIWLRTASNTRIDGNTIYQPGTGDAIQVNGSNAVSTNSVSPSTNVTVTNNILRVARDYGIRVAQSGITGFVSDYNNVSTIGSGKYGRWEDRDFVDREDWSFELDLDRHSTIFNPLYVDIDGTDNVLGYDTLAGVDHGLDDNFSVLPGSLTIDAGDPRSASTAEPLPNGGRRNLGHTGDTPQATTSPTQVLQILSPNGREKFEVGQSVRIDWQSAGLTAVRPAALIDAGGTGADGWSADAYKIAGQTVAFANPVSLLGVANPAPAATYQTGTEGGFGVNNRVAYQFPVSDGSYTIRLHFVEPTATAAGQRLFDIRLQGTTVWSGFDIFAATGGQFKATTVSFTALASSGQGIALEMVNLANTLGAIITAIELAGTNPSGFPNPTVNVQLSTNSGATWTSLAAGIAMDPFGRGSLLWTPSGETSGNTALVRVTANVGSLPQDVSDVPFLVTNSGHDFYVNDGSTTSDVFTTIIGSHLASGKRPHEPMAGLPGLLAAYDLEPGDVIHVDSGTYRQYRNLLISAQDSGVRIEGPGIVSGASGVAQLQRANSLVGNYVIELGGADDITVDYLSLTGATIGVYAPANSRSDRLTVSNSDIFGSQVTESGTPAYGVYIGEGNDDTRLVGNRVHNNINFFGNGTAIFVRSRRGIIENNEAYGQTIGIAADFTGSALSSDLIHIRGNSVRDNTLTGIDVSRVAVATNNTVFGHSGAGAVGILGREVTVANNVVFGNTLGIQVFDGVALHNIVYGNTVGIRGRGGAMIEANQAYSNSVGISGDPFGGFSGLISNNLVYANTSQGIYIERSSGAGIRILHNTVHQSVGDAVRIENNSFGTTLRNNVIWVDSGHDVYVATNSQIGFSSNYNLLHQGTDSQAHVGFWGGVDRDSLGDWQSVTGQDANSIFGDPRWVDRDGPDNVLGYTTIGGGYDGGSDDNFHLRGGSPAIDRADATLSPLVDRDALPRIDDLGTINAGAPTGLAYFDLGAQEFQGSSADVTAPRVLTSLIETLGTTNNFRHEVQIHFSEPLDTLDARSPGNYQLRAVGLNGTFGDSDDTVFLLEPRYVINATVVTLDIVGSSNGLPAGLFRLTVRDSAHDASGNALDGDQNGQSGGDYVRSNGRPMLNAIPNRSTPERHRFGFSAVANDEGILSYSLAAGAPVGATIDPVSGVFTWTPTLVQGPGNYPIAVIARDNGMPAMNDRQSFTLTVTAVDPAIADFNRDGHFDSRDIDLLSRQIALRTHAIDYDLSGDGLVNLTDRDVWLELAGTANLASGNPYQLGDANLDGVVDGSDFGLWNANKFTLDDRWSHGDFNADGAVDGSDFSIWSSNNFKASDMARPSRATRVVALRESLRRERRVDNLFGRDDTWYV